MTEHETYDRVLTALRAGTDRRSLAAVDKKIDELRKRREVLEYREERRSQQDRQVAQFRLNQLRRRLKTCERTRSQALERNKEYVHQALAVAQRHDQAHHLDRRNREGFLTHKARFVQLVQSEFPGWHLERERRNIERLHQMDQDLMVMEEQRRADRMAFEKELQIRETLSTKEQALMLAQEYARKEAVEREFYRQQLLNEKQESVRVIEESRAESARLWQQAHFREQAQRHQQQQAQAQQARSHSQPTSSNDLSSMVHPPVVPGARGVHPVELQPPIVQTPSAMTSLRLSQSLQQSMLQPPSSVYQQQFQQQQQLYQEALQQQALQQAMLAQQFQPSRAGSSTGGAPTPQPDAPLSQNGMDQVSDASHSSFPEIPSRPVAAAPLQPKPSPRQHHVAEPREAPATAGAHETAPPAQQPSPAAPQPAPVEQPAQAHIEGHHPQPQPAAGQPQQRSATVAGAGTTRKPPLMDLNDTFSPPSTTQKKTIAPDKRKGELMKADSMFSSMDTETDDDLGILDIKSSDVLVPFASDDDLDDADGSAQSGPAVRSGTAAHATTAPSRKPPAKPPAAIGAMPSALDHSKSRTTAPPKPHVFHRSMSSSFDDEDFRDVDVEALDLGEDSISSIQSPKTGGTNPGFAAQSSSQFLGARRGAGGNPSALRSRSISAPSAGVNYGRDDSSASDDDTERVVEEATRAALRKQEEERAQRDKTEDVNDDDDDDDDDDDTRDRKGVTFAPDTETAAADNGEKSKAAESKKRNPFSILKFRKKTSMQQTVLATKTPAAEKAEDHADEEDWNKAASRAKPPVDDNVVVMMGDDDSDKDKDNGAAAAPPKPAPATTTVQVVQPKPAKTVTVVSVAGSSGVVASELDEPEFDFET